MDRDVKRKLQSASTHFRIFVRHNQYSKKFSVFTMLFFHMFPSWSHICTVVNIFLLRMHTLRSSTRFKNDVVPVARSSGRANSICIVSFQSNARETNAWKVAQRLFFNYF